jgi:uncharacterized protein YdcH (DUF465 family)
MMSNAECISKDILIKEIKEHISSIVGYGTLNALEAYLEMNNVSFDDIFEEYAKISESLDVIFGNGSSIIKKEIISIIKRRCKIKDVKDLESIIKDVKELIKD